MMAGHEEQIGRAIWIDQGRVNSYCRTVNPDFLKRRIEDGDVMALIDRSRAFALPKGKQKR